MFRTPWFRDGRIEIDDKLKVQADYAKDVYAIGDCAVNPKKPLPMIAQAAKQQAVYLGKVFQMMFRYFLIKCYVV